MLAFSAIFFTGCKKELALNPTNGISSDIVFNNPSDFEQASKGMYAGLRGGPLIGTYPAYGANYLGGLQLILPDVLSDNLIINQNGRRSQQSFFQWIYSSTATWNIFTDGYIPIRRANAIIEHINNLPDGVNKDNFKGEALAIRAMAHFDLLRIYGKRFNPATQATDLGIPYVVSTDPSLLPARMNVKDIYDKIVADFTEAEAKIKKSNGVGRLNKAAVAGLLARVHLYRNDFVAAAAAADRSIAVEPGVSDNPGTIAQLPDIFQDASEAGVLFKVRTLDEDQVKIGVVYSQTSAGEVRSEYVPAYDLYKMYTNTDVRKTTYFKTSIYLGSNYNHVALYIQRPNSTANVFDFKVLRVAEVLLTQAEAYAQNSTVKDEAKARIALDKLRSNRYTGFTPGNETGQALLDAIAKERRLELAFQGDRFYDLKRKNVAIVRDAVHGEYADGTGTPVPAAARTLAVGDKRWYFPFPQAELNVNKNILQDMEWR